MGLLLISFIIYCDQIIKCPDYYETHTEVFISEVTHL